MNTSSTVGFICTFDYTDYAAAKFGVLGFSEALRSEFKQYNVGVSVLSPPDTDTPGFVEENKTNPHGPRAGTLARGLHDPAFETR